MDYVDPYHKRIELRAKSFTVLQNPTSSAIQFACSEVSVMLRRNGTRLVALISSEETEFPVWKLQLLNKLGWFVIDVRDSRLSRMVVHVGALDPEALWACVPAVVKDCELLCHRH